MTAPRDGRGGNRAGRPGPSAGRGPSPAIHTPSTLGAALSQLFTIKGFASTRTDAELSAAWRELAGDRVADKTAVGAVNRGVLNVSVANSALLNELSSFHKARLVEGLKARFPAMKLRDIKFRLRGDLAKPANRKDGEKDGPRITRMDANDGSTNGSNRGE